MSASDAIPDFDTAATTDVQVVHVSLPLARVALLKDIGDARNPIPSVAQAGLASRDLEPRLNLVIPPESPKPFDAIWIDADGLSEENFLLESTDKLTREAQEALLKEDLVVALDLFERTLVVDVSNEFARYGATYCRCMLKPRREVEPIAIDELEGRLDAGPEDPWLRFFAARMCERFDRTTDLAIHVAALQSDLTIAPELNQAVDQLVAELGPRAEAPVLPSLDPLPELEAEDDFLGAESEPAVRASTPDLPPRTTARVKADAAVGEQFFERPIGAVLAVLLLTSFLTTVGVFNGDSAKPVLVLARSLIVAVFAAAMLLTVFRERVDSAIQKGAGVLPVFGGLGLGLAVGHIIPPAAVPPVGAMAALLVQVAAIEALFRLYVDQVLMDRIDSQFAVVILSGALFGAFAIQDPAILHSASWAEGCWRAGMMALFGGVPFAFVHTATKSVVPPFLCHLAAQVVASVGA